MHRRSAHASTAFAACAAFTAYATCAAALMLPATATHPAAGIPPAAEPALTLERAPAAGSASRPGEPLAGLGAAQREALLRAASRLGTSDRALLLRALRRLDVPERLLLARLIAPPCAESGSLPPEPGVRGVIRQVLPASHPAHRPGRIAVSGTPGPQAGLDRALVLVTPHTRIRFRCGKVESQGQFHDLRAGQRVEVRFAGPLVRAYPVQISARDIRVYGGKPGPERRPEQLRIRRKPA